MNILRFQQWTILPKIMTIPLISVTVMLAATFAYYIQRRLSVPLDASMWSADRNRRGT